MSQGSERQNGEDTAADACLVEPQFRIPKEPCLSLRLLTLGRNSNWLPIGPGSRDSCFWARSGIYHSLKSFGVGEGNEVLLPSYLCAAASTPIGAVGARAVFYDVTRTCQPNWEDIRRKVTRKSRALLAVHYFGFPQPIADLRKLCDDLGLFLIEDCAHVLAGVVHGQSLGTFGHASVFSWRKLLPLYDGAEVLLNTREHKVKVCWRPESLRFKFEVAKGTIDHHIQYSGDLVARSLQAVFAWAKRRWLREGEVCGSRFDRNAYDLTPDVLHRAMSQLSRAILEHSDVRKILWRRRENYRWLHENLRSLRSVELLWAEVPDGASPWIFPIIIRGMPRAHRRLRQFGIPAVSWDDVRPAQVNIGEFPDADFLYDNLVFLPIHQNLDETQLRCIAESVRALVRR